MVHYVMIMKNKLMNKDIHLENMQKQQKKLGFGLVINHVHGILTDSMYDKALQKLQKEIVKHLKIKEGEANED